MENNERHDRMDQLRSIYDSECEEFAETLYLCALAEHRGAPVKERFGTFLAHRAVCERCRETYRDVLFMLVVEAEEGLREPEVIPDLPIPGADEVPAPSPPVADRNVLSRGAGWLVERTAAGARLLIDLVDLGALAGGGLRMQTRAGEHVADETRAVGELLIDTVEMDAAPDIEVRLTLLVARDDPEQATVRVEIGLPERWPDFSGVTVALHVPGKPTRRQVTGHNGVVRFSGLARRAVETARVVVELP